MSPDVASWYILESERAIIVCVLLSLILNTSRGFDASVYSILRMYYTYMLPIYSYFIESNYKTLVLYWYDTAVCSIAADFFWCIEIWRSGMYWAGTDRRVLWCSMLTMISDPPGVYWTGFIEPLWQQVTNTLLIFICIEGRGVSEYEGPLLRVASQGILSDKQLRRYNL